MRGVFPAEEKGKDGSRRKRERREDAVHVGFSHPHGAVLFGDAAPAKQRPALFFKDFFRGLFLPLFPLLPHFHFSLSFLQARPAFPPL